MVIGGLGIPSELQDAGYPYLATTIEVVGTIESLLAGSPQPFPAAFELLRSNGRTRDCPPEQTHADEIAHRLGLAAGEAAEIARGHVRRVTTYRDLAFRDPLTDMPNRRAFDERLETYTDDPDGTTLILIIDVNQFKEVNDELGHLAGDRLLVRIGDAIIGSLRGGDLAARLGGDEFGALLPDASASDARAIGDRIHVAVARIEAPVVTVSIGTAELWDDSRQAMHAADIALYEAKLAGRVNATAAGSDVPQPLTAGLTWS